jgi:hypothetical protein
VFLHRIKAHNRESGKQYDITLEDLKVQWEKQHGICPYTGWTMKRPVNSTVRRSVSPDSASVDRIDSSKGYTKDNIQFICLMAQYAKNTFQEADVLKFCEAVVRHRS